MSKNVKNVFHVFPLGKLPLKIFRGIIFYTLIVQRTYMGETGDIANLGFRQRGLLNNSQIFS
jgi:hypothetical protein